MTSPPVFTSDVVVECPPKANGQRLKMAARRYYTDIVQNEAAITLLFLHGTGNHKEQWEPIIHDLFSRQSAAVSTQHIREVWSVDWMTHGDSAVLNAELLRDVRVTIADWAAAVHALVETHLQGRRLICVGHSSGANTLMYSTSLWPSPAQLPFECMILVEPSLIDRETFNAHIEDRRRQLGTAVKSISTKKDEWDSRDAAYEWFSTRPPWKSWDPRVIRILVESGLRSIPSSSKVTLKSNKQYEARHYTEEEESFLATEQIEKVCASIPLHAIFGKRTDLVPKYATDCMTDVKKGRRFASITVIPDAGHMVLQQQPARLAEALWKIVSQSSPASHQRPSVALSRL